MDPLAQILDYHGTERMLGLVVTGVGAAALASAVYVWRTRADAVGRGLLVPLLLVALGGVVGGPMLAAKSVERIESLAAMYERDPASVAALELPRMERVNGNWLPLKITWVTLAAVGVFVIVRIRRPFWRGVSIGTVGLSCALLVVDITAERRAETYTAALKSIPGP
jgi:hypothetical protein